ncbi:phospholipid/cholesterol/gamma-HCH transport system ATP-binding protein [Hydrogenivirga caldilitoris]|uniref:Phospholipid/cholesterol/gamma-HCH transport system ATP-binding protein n=1 Tax=Hydrogenivirga caldilitoris TaxID=246264 RepID=A0A497XNQ7_9AQUI|nr:ATP-binding cassette domain-containing protein [Hydrogenivirga caldilitoris]RLJ70575.1 phospholipid/cholesterol/gamma-HCH transport system ATP-binding protein [Hydrogenivirga caldilitoris]
MSRTIVKVESLYKDIEGRKILKNVSFEVTEREIFSIIGGSGSGKTSITKHIIGLWKPTSGRVLVFGKEVSKLSLQELDELRKNIGYVFQEGALFDSLKVWENVGFYFLEHTNMSRREVRDIALEKLRLVDLDEDVLDLMPSELSGGMRKRVSIARAIATDPKLIIYDEPTSGLDPITSRVIDKLILQLRERTGTTAIVVTHDMISAFTISDRVLVLKKGETVAIGEPEEVLNSPDPFIQEFIGDMKDCLTKQGRGL